MKRDHYIIPIYSLSTAILDATCYLTHSSKFVTLCLLYPTTEIFKLGAYVALIAPLDIVVISCFIRFDL